MYQQSPYVSTRDTCLKALLHLIWIIISIFSANLRPTLKFAEHMFEPKLVYCGRTLSTHSVSISNKDIPSRIIFLHRFVTLDIRNAIIGLDSDFRAKHFVLDHSKVNVMLILDLPFFTNKVFEQSTQFICCTFLSKLKSFQNLNQFSSDIVLNFVF